MWEKTKVEESLRSEIQSRCGNKLFEQLCYCFGAKYRIRYTSVDFELFWGLMWEWCLTSLLFNKKKRKSFVDSSGGGKY